MWSWDPGSKNKRQTNEQNVIKGTLDWNKNNNNNSKSTCKSQYHSPHWQQSTGKQYNNIQKATKNVKDMANKLTLLSYL
jgi:hypothetical protein